MAGSSDSPTWKRGNVSRSKSPTLSPARARNAAVVEPPGPPPMTATSYCRRHHDRPPGSDVREPRASRAPGAQSRGQRRDEVGRDSPTSATSRRVCTSTSASTTGVTRSRRGRVVEPAGDRVDHRLADRRVRAARGPERRVPANETARRVPRAAGARHERASPGAREGARSHAPSASPSRARQVDADAHAVADGTKPAALRRPRKRAHRDLVDGQPPRCAAATAPRSRTRSRRAGSAPRRRALSGYAPESRLACPARWRPRRPVHEEPGDADRVQSTRERRAPARPSRPADHERSAAPPRPRRAAGRMSAGSC